VRLIEADQLVRLPDAISFDQAAAMMLQGMTAQVLIRQIYTVKAGDLILVHAAAGGIGLILCQWAADLGATVIGTVSTEAKAELAHAHGCKHTILYSKQDFVAEVSRISGSEKRDALEASAKELFEVVASGKVRINANQRFALKDAADAQRALEGRATSGSTILTI
jgi:NADPH:quinone reductase-like Zn-dependent oxidoreductase